MKEKEAYNKGYNELLEIVINEIKDKIRVNKEIKKLSEYDKNFDKKVIKIRGEAFKEVLNFLTEIVGKRK